MVLPVSLKYFGIQKHEYINYYKTFYRLPLRGKIHYNIYFYKEVALPGQDTRQ